MATSTKGRLLVAEPTMTDPNFARTVVFMLEHSAMGALGLVLNRPSGVPVAEIVPAWADAAGDGSEVFLGGPVSPDAAICLGRRHVATASSGDGDDRPVAGWEPVVGRIGAMDLHMDPADGPVGLVDVRVFAGHAGWSAGQLDGELDLGGWFVVDSEEDDVFGDPDGMWARVLRRQTGPLRGVAHFPDDVRHN